MNQQARIFALLTAGVLLLALSGCYTDKSRRNLEYAPNMYNSLPLEPYSQTVFWETNIGGNYEAARKDGRSPFANGLNAQRSPEGTVPRTGSWITAADTLVPYTPYPHPNTPEGYEAANGYLSPINMPDRNGKGIQCTEESFKRGKEVYEIYCQVCHGAKGDGQGTLAQKGVLGGVPAYNSGRLATMTAGQMYHSITYGRNNMGSYAGQLTPRQRWEVICYIQQFQPAPGAAQAAPATN